MLYLVQCKTIANWLNLQHFYNILVKYTTCCLWQFSLWIQFIYEALHWCKKSGLFWSIWLPQFHTFHHWRIPLAKRSPMTLILQTFWKI